MSTSDKNSLGWKRIDKKRHFAFLLAWAAISLMLPQARAGEAIPSRISGRLLDIETRKPLSGAHLYVQPDKGVSIEAKTDGDGRFSIESFEDAHYDIYMATYACINGDADPDRFEIVDRKAWRRRRDIVAVTPEIAWNPKLIQGISIYSARKPDTREAQVEVDNEDLGDIYADRSPVVACKVVDERGLPMGGTFVKFSGMEGLTKSLDPLYVMTDQNGVARMPLIGFYAGCRWKCESYFPRTIDLAEGIDTPFFYHERPHRSEPLKSIAWLNPLPPIVWQPFSRKTYDFEIKWLAEKNAATIRGAVRFAKTKKPVEDFWLRVDALGVVDSAVAYGKPQSLSLKSGFVRDGFDINTLYRREFKSPSGEFALGHFQPGTTLQFEAVDTQGTAWGGQILKVDDYADKPLELYLQPQQESNP